MTPQFVPREPVIDLDGFNESGQMIAVAGVDFVQQPWPVLSVEQAFKDYMREKPSPEVCHAA